MMNICKDFIWSLHLWRIRGITIWLEGAKSSSQDVASQLCVQEESTYMRDYIFDEGVLKEVHFDKIRKDLP